MSTLEGLREGPSFQRLEELLEAEVSERLGRGYYESGGDGAESCRNGYRTGRLATAEGEVEYCAPQVRGLEAPFRSRLRPELGKRTEKLEDLAGGDVRARALDTRHRGRAVRREGPLALVAHGPGRR